MRTKGAFQLTLLKTLFVITITTSRLFFPSVPETGEAGKPLAFRSLHIELASDMPADRAAKASVVVPAALGVGNEVKLTIDSANSSAAKPETAKFELREYWGSGRNIAADQPKITGSDKNMESEAQQIIPDKSFAFWPAIDPKAYEDTAKLEGAYKLNTTYCGATSVELTSDQNFLPPINITTAAQHDLEKPISLKWMPVPGAVGYILRAYGGNQKRTITWTSSAKPELAHNIENRPVSSSDLADYIKYGVLIPPHIVTNTIPAGVFKGSSSVMLIITAIGKDIVQDKDGITTWALVRSSASVPLYSTPRESNKKKH